MKLIEEMRREAARIRKYRQGESCQLSLAGLIQDWSDALATSGALVPVRVEPEPGKRADWYMTPSGLGWMAYDVRGHEYIDTPGDIYGINDTDCYPVRLVPIAEWEAEG